MSMTANETMTAAEWREHRAESRSDTYEALTGADSAVAVDPGRTTGVAVVREDGSIETHTTDFWELNRATIDHRWMELVPWIVECPQKTRFGVHGPDTRREVYNSGGVAREAMLLVEGLEKLGYDVYQQDPAKYETGTWSEKVFERMGVEWKGGKSAHERDAVKMLVLWGIVP